MKIKLRENVIGYPGRKVGIRVKGKVDYNSERLITHNGVEIEDELAKEMIKQNPNVVVEVKKEAKKQSKKFQPDPPPKKVKESTRKELIAMAKAKGLKDAHKTKTVDLITFLEGGGNDPI